jgi:shikimate kinase
MGSTPMNQENRPRHIVCLIGFMGSGKSTVAKLLRRQTGWPSIDLDKRIMEATGLPITDIFQRMGEAEFRQIEHEQLQRALAEAAEQEKPTIISLGGGTITQAQNIALLREHEATLIWLQCPIEELLHRCAQINDRPLFRDEQSFRQLYQDRLPFYELAEFRVDSSSDPMRVVEQIIGLGIFPRVIA